MFRTLQSQKDEIYGFFSVERILVEIKSANGYKKEERTIAYCNNIKEFIKYVSCKRSLGPVENLFIKVGCDGGGNSLKLSMTIDSDEQVTQRTLKTGKNSGVKKLFLIGIIVNTPETHFNLKIIFEKAQMQDPLIYGNNVWYPGDLKMYNKSVGLQEHACSHPCCFCDCPKTNFRSQSCSPRTFGSIRDNYQKWIKSGSDMRKTSDFKNCVADPILNGVPDSAPINEFYPPPELHLMLGAFRHLYKLMLKVDPDNVRK